MLMTGIANIVHVLGAVVWVGGMFFAYMVLRPASVSLQPPQRLGLWVQIFGRFFPWVWSAIVLLLLSGYWMIFGFFGGFGNSGLHIHIMHGLGLLMMLLFLHLFFAPYQRLRATVEAQDWPAAARQLSQIRQIVGINLVLGLITVCVAAGGRYLL